MVEDRSAAVLDDSAGQTYGRRSSARRRPLAAVDDAGLVTLARRGSQLAWDEIVHRFSDLLAAIARQHRLSEADSADVAQITWVQLFRHLGDLRRPEKLAYWLATTARHECLRVLGSSREQPVDPTGADAWPSSGTDPLESVLVAECRRAVRDAVDRMPSHSRRLLELLVWERRSYTEVAATMAMAVGSVGPTRGRALRRLASQPDVVRLVADGVPAA
jgi:RNA polymerase sigma factor (sigma-70 family)